MQNKIRVHFMGICGSGMSSIAVVAKQNGYEVSGCDMSISDYYGQSLAENDIEVLEGHDVSHLENVDIVAISPAILDVSPNHPEVVEAKNRGILMTWQEFMANYLHKGKELISISGTHGKTTTTILTGVLLEKAGLDPTVVAGTNYSKWGKGCRIGETDLFVCEADEFNNNFLNYESSIAVVNNLEMDHPESFSDFTMMKEAFKSFIKKLKGPKILIIYEESAGIREIIDELRVWLSESKVKLIGYYIHNHFDYPYYKEYKVNIVNQSEQQVEYEIQIGNQKDTIIQSIPGEYNVNNTMSAICIALELGVSKNVIFDGVKAFHGVGRRFELVGIVDDIRIYDDYAHHPTAITSVLSMCKKNNPNQRIWAILEPHQISRIRMFFKEFTTALGIADHVIITKTHLGREIHKGITPISREEWTDAIGEDKTWFIEEAEEVTDFITKNAQTGDLVVVFGAANSYHISRSILTSLMEHRKTIDSI
ncbi:MAG: UDP-N-acetylmuramate--L-alanine ligase [Anaerocolumna sp.]|jgi:UDP-N-acetylmuramate--alanine ligase|nr:UDP-N-acetylmuramate--L-alanine ligase [Anaerocolumna sp.]